MKTMKAKLGAILLALILIVGLIGCISCLEQIPAGYTKEDLL